MRECSVEGCRGKHGTKGLCYKHFMRYQRTGDPNNLGSDKFKASRWILEHLDWTEDDCLIFPFSKFDKGYGRITVDRKGEYVHTVICTIVHGHKPTHVHQVRHLCGNGHLGCVNPMHLRWGTPKENGEDRIVHETDCRGEKHSKSKLTEPDVLEIVAKINDGVSFNRISKDYPVTSGTVRKIGNGLMWSWLTGIVPYV